MGCFNEDNLDPDLSVSLWGLETVASPQECILACADRGHLYAGENITHVLI